MTKAPHIGPSLDGFLKEEGLLEEKQRTRLERLRAEILAGIDSGPGRLVDEVCADLEAKYTKMAQEHGI